ncbi:MAG TPA: cadherin repeat domain-containing protein [Burkholderiales bacterium]|nr:cadherin repeat domain-containing protein [Burkholderiales bacterium]
MTRTKIAICALVVIAGTTGMVEAANFNDGNGKEWRQLTGTVGLSWNQVAQFCPQDGASSCVGSTNLNGWVWGTDAQVLQLFGIFEPAILTSPSASVQGVFGSAQSFLSGFAFQPTTSFCETYFCGASASGWTASKDATDSPLVGFVGWGNTNVSISGSFSIAAAASADATGPGVWLWRATGPGANAYDDAGQVASPDGGVAVADVLVNDWVAGTPATTASVAISQVSSTDPGVSVDVGSGSVNVAAGTVAGTYTLSYRICDISNASSCDDATVTVVVNPYVVSAANDSGWASPSTGGTAVANVLANDRLSGTPATIANVSLSLVSVSGAGITLNPADGSVSVARGTALGSYSLVYQICDKTDPANCAQATATVTVRNYVIIAVGDSARGSSKTGSTPIANVLANDMFNGARATTATVQLSQVSPPAAGITLNTSTGAVSVAPKTSSGTYNIVYSICEIASPANCSSATVTLDLSGKL